MRAIVQRVAKAKVCVMGEIVGAIGRGHLVFIAFKDSDGEPELSYMAEKILNLRLFEDEQDKMNLSLQDIGGELLVVSQFTLYGDARKGRRPSFSASAPAQQAEQLYERFLQILRQAGIEVASGRFQAHMQVELINDGPVTIMLDSDRLF